MFGLWTHLRTQCHENFFWSTALILTVFTPANGQTQAKNNFFLLVQTILIRVECSIDWATAVGQHCKFIIYQVKSRKSVIGAKCTLEQMLRRYSKHSILYVFSWDLCYETFSPSQALKEQIS